jgi:hypothetical protein
MDGEQKEDKGDAERRILRTVQASNCLISEEKTKGLPFPRRLVHSYETEQW